MICQTIDIVDGNFCGYPVHFQAVCILDSWLQAVAWNCRVMNLKQNEAQSAWAESTHKGVNQLSKYVTQTQQRPESPTVTHLACV